MFGKKKQRWKEGIPEYKDTDILKGAELQGFCADIVADYLDKQGYEIIRILYEARPVQIIAEKNEQTHVVMVVGDVFPFIADASCNMKKFFADYTKSNHYIPEFASVSIMSQDTTRAYNGLALKDDGYMIRFKGNENLMNYELPKINDNGYRAYCMEELVASYTNGDFSNIYDMLADDVEYSSAWVKETLKGKSALLAYYEGKGKAIRDTDIRGAVLRAWKGQCPLNKLADDGFPVAMIRQNLREQQNVSIIIPMFNEDDKIVALSMEPLDKYTLRPYYVI